jgi:hypothetical protein
MRREDIMPHYTSTSQNAFIERLTSDFIGQIARRLEVCKTTQIELAKKLDATESEVSQVLNLNRINLTLKTMVRYARALGLKLAVVAYDDGDPTNQNGPIGSEIFSMSWEKIGRPRNIWAVNEASYATTKSVDVIPNCWTYSCVTTTLGGISSTAGKPQHIPEFLTLSEKATYAGNQELRI